MAAGAAVRTLHDAPLTPWQSHRPSEQATRLDSECTWLLANDVLPADLTMRHRDMAQAALRGREMRGWLHVDTDADGPELEQWVSRGLAYARSLPPKSKKGPPGPGKDG